MHITIADATIDDILKIAVKSEIEFLARKLLQTPEVRKLLWCYLMQNMPIKGVKGAGVKDDSLINGLNHAFAFGIRPPSGGGGGADDGESTVAASGGGSEGPPIVKAGECKLWGPTGASGPTGATGISGPTGATELSGPTGATKPGIEPA